MASDSTDTAAATDRSQVRGDLMKALTQLKDRKHDFDLVLVETTGLANPAPVTATFTQNPVVANHFRVDGIICLVDSKFILEHINEKRADDTINEAVTQVMPCRGRNGCNETLM